MMTRGKRIAFLLINLVAAAVLRAEVSTTPPPEYETSIRPLLTLLEDISARKDPHAGKDEPGTVRLAEQVTRVKEDGTYLRAVHYIVQPYSTKGADATANDRYRFYSRQETVHLALARTVLPDGTSKLLGPNAAFLQKGNRGSASTYDDAQDLVVVFPDVKPGVLCEAIVVYERKEPSVKRGYSNVIDWSPGWPVGEIRHVLDFPAAWKDRLKEHAVAVKEVRATDLPAAEGRLCREWKRGSTGRPPYEPNRAPAAQVGPATWIGTFASWDEMAAWYQGLLRGQDVLDDELKAKVTEWTADAKSPREILDVLYDRVANDIRYEGLEFGVSGLQPYTCGTVWKNQYGDCKDKANLLVAMLRHRGVPAKVVLVNTDDAGVVHRDIPDFRHFNHAIAVAELPAEGGGVQQVFCDATIRHGRPGLLGPSSAGRDVLAIDGGKAQWLKTPEVDAGEDFYRFDLAVDEEGRLTGWLSITSKGYYAVRLASAYGGADRESARDRLTSLVEDFIDGAEVVDVVLPAEQRIVDEVTVKAYVTGPPRQRDNGGRLSLPFPSSPGLFNDYGDTQVRQTSYFQWRDRTRVETTVRLPAGWRPESLPQPLKLDTPAYLAEASWSHGEGTCTASLRLDCREAVIAAGAVAGPAQANRSLAAWLGVPLLLTQAEGKAADKPAPIGQVELPLMPTGQGQMTLVNRLFPAGSDAAKRRAALEKVVSYFPNDPSTVHDARVQIAYLRVLADEYPAAVAELAPLAARRPEGVDAESFAFTRYLHAMALQETGETEAALKVMRELVADAGLSDYRRGWSASLAGTWLAERKPVPVEALELLKQAVAFGGEAAEPALVVLIPAMASTGQGEALADMMAKGDALDAFEDGGASVLKQITDGVTEKAGELQPWLARARDLAEDEDRKKHLATAATALESWLSRGEAYATVRARVLAALELRGTQYFDGTKPGDTAAATEAMLDGLNGKDRKKWIATAAAYFRTFEPSPQFSRVVWHLLGHFSAVEEKDEGVLFDELAEASALLPKSDDHYWECRFTHSWRLRDTSKVKDAEAIQRAMTEDPALPADFTKTAWSALGESHELQGRWDEAAACYAKFKEDRHGFRVVVEGILRAGLLRAHLGEREDALEIWKLLADVPATTYDDSPLISEIVDAIALSADPDATLEQWKRMDGWWKDSFVPLLKSLGLEELGQRPYLADQGTAVDVRCRKALAEKDVTMVAKDLAAVGLSFRWLPCHIGSLQTMLSLYVKPLRPQTVSRQERVVEDAAAAVSIAKLSVIEYCLRLHAGMAVDRGEPALTLKLLDGQWGEAPGRGDEHRERSAYVFGMAAVASGERLPDALAISSAVIEKGPGFVNAGTWFSLHADLLAKSGKQSEAIAFLKGKSTDPAIKADAKVLDAITTKLDALTKSAGHHEGLEASVRGYIETLAPSWYANVGPADLDDPRVGDVDKVLSGDLSRFHPAERQRLRLLIALSDRATAEVRERAYGEALVEAAASCRTLPEADAVWSHAIDDEALPLTLRLPLLWKAAVSATMTGQVELLAKLAEKPVFQSFAEAYAKRYYPLLQDIAKSRRDGAGAASQAVLDRLAGKELDAVELQVAGMFHAFLLGAGDLDAAVAAREAMKSWKLAPGTSGSILTTRLAWLRLENTAKPSIEFDRAMRGIFLPVLERVAKDAPAGWEQRMNVEQLDDLTERQADGVRAATVMKAAAHDATEGARWLRYPSFWFSSGGKTDHAKALEFFKLALGIKDDFRANLALSGTLVGMELPADGSWKEIDAVLDEALKANKSQAVGALIDFWRAFRDRKVGDPVDVPQAVLNAKKMSMLGIAVYGSSMEALIANGDKAGLESLLGEIKPDDFLDGTGIATYAAALEMLGRTDELELVRESVPDVIRKEMMSAWYEGSVSSARRTLDLAAGFDHANLLPGAWRKDMATLTVDPMGAALMAARLARLDRDWQEMLAALAKVKDQAEDDETGWHYLNAVAHVGLGKPELARPHLDKVIRAGILDGASFVQAVVLLKSLDELGK
ncbi:DUF3857 domain-containing protein [Luteolibacter arcticus]|uniref:DUF3857 domain-containing protein n=1 Tax=Luteolibacter arcticus TaxID=1581411 RepID=A0ABT3GRH8_9BACT|nr:DUF3857 domain-containing protein [Luteolibacter arcticus]MCW1926092.1 DUF3857 domain-containing protein [Luteolibacter arcticus]